MMMIANVEMMMIANVEMMVMNLEMRAVALNSLMVVGWLLWFKETRERARNSFHTHVAKA